MYSAATKRSCDVTFLVGPSKEEIRAHKRFLKARSEMLRESFSEKWEDKDSIELPQFDPKAFKSFLEFAYTDQVNLAGTDWISVLEVADYFLVKPLVDICADIGLRDARSDIGKALHVFQAVQFYGHRKTMDEIGELMANSFVKLSKTERFLEEVDDDTLCYLLQLDHLRVNECELFKIVLRVAEARARNRGGDGDDVPVTTVASEMEKFIPFIRIRIMTLSEFRIVMDASHLLPPEAVVDPIRFFTATYSEEKKTMASAWSYNNVERRCKEFLKFYKGPSGPQIRREISLDDFQPEDCIRFYLNAINLYRAEAERMSSCGSKGFVVTGVGIQCPTLLQGATGITEIYFICRIEIQVGDYRSWHSPSGGGIDKIEMTCSVKPNGLTEVPINPPVLLPSGLGKGVRITAQVTVGPSKEKKSGQKCILLKCPKAVLASRAKAEFCSHKIEVTELWNEQQPDYYARNWQLITGIRVQAL